MYSILKTQKRSLRHKKYSSITSSIFLTNHHILFTFADSSLSVYSLHLSSPQPETLVWEDYTLAPVIQSKRLSETHSVLLCKHVSHIYILQHQQNHIEHTLSMKLKQQTNRSVFANFIGNQFSNGLLNAMGCQFKIHAFANLSYIIEFYVYEDKKIVYDCYKHREIKSQTNENANKMYFTKQENITHQWELQALQIDLQINGHYVSEPINSMKGLMGVYKQQQITDSDWLLRVYAPFYQSQLHFYPQNPSQNNNKQIRVIFPSQIFTQQMIILQICQYLDDNYMIIVGNKVTGKLSAYIMAGLSATMIGSGTLGQNALNFIKIAEQKCTFLNDRFIKMMYINTKDEIFYALCHTHMRVNGQLYENGLLIGNLKNGTEIQKGYCSLKNIDFSPNYRYILDVPYDFENYGQTFYHIRLLLSKSSLYMLMIEKCDLLSGFGDAFKEAIVTLL